MEILTYFLVIVYSVSIFVIGLYCLTQFYLFLQYFISKKPINTPSNPDDEDWPEVTIQLPIFNEKYVAQRLIENIINLDYPKEKIAIQILDDSTDETLEITKKICSNYQNVGYTIEWIHRKDRTGFKAGALKEGLTKITSPFIAIFDADFLPEPDFLKKTIPHFIEPKTGVVQTRWSHLNQHQNVLTELQAIQLNVHFTMEQSGRFLAGHFLQFNGTAGVWRTETIRDAGGWEADTLTEDLDLSYRAQLKGWKIKYLEDIPTPAELPSDLSGLKSQQFRWMKGGAENAKKLLPKIWSSSISLGHKIQATAHLMSSSIFFAVLGLSLSSLALVFLLPTFSLDLNFLQYFLFSFVSVIVIYLSGNVIALREKKPLWKRLILFCAWFPVFLSLSMAMAWHNSFAVWEGWNGKKSPFVRTPKFGFQTKEKSYQKKSWTWIQSIEVLLALLFLSTIIAGLFRNYTQFIYLHILLFLGYSALVFYGLQDVRKS